MIGEFGNLSKDEMERNAKDSLRWSDDACLATSVNEHQLQSLRTQYDVLTDNEKSLWRFGIAVYKNPQLIEGTVVPIIGLSESIVGVPPYALMARAAGNRDGITDGKIRFAPHVVRASGPYIKWIEVPVCLDEKEPYLLSILMSLLKWEKSDANTEKLKISAILAGWEYPETGNWASRLIWSAHKEIRATKGYLLTERLCHPFRVMVESEVEMYQVAGLAMEMLTLKANPDDLMKFVESHGKYENTYPDDAFYWTRRSSKIWLNRVLSETEIPKDTESDDEKTVLLEIPGDRTIVMNMTMIKKYKKDNLTTCEALMQMARARCNTEDTEIFGLLAGSEGPISIRQIPIRLLYGPRLLPDEFDPIEAGICQFRVVSKKRVKELYDIEERMQMAAKHVLDMARDKNAQST